MTREKNTPVPELQPLPAPTSHPTPTGPEEGLVAARSLKAATGGEAPTDAPFDKRMDVAWTKWGSL